MAVDVMKPQVKEKKSPLETAATVTNIASNAYGMYDKATAKTHEPKAEPSKSTGKDYNVGVDVFERKKPAINYTPR